jgi:NitT/TauT family transport system permease protein
MPQGRLRRLRHRLRRSGLARKDPRRARPLPARAAVQPGRSHAARLDAREGRAADRTAALGGFAASAIIGVPIAMWISYSRTVESFVYPLLVFSQSVPKVAIAPLFVVWFGFGIVPKVIAAFLLGFFPVVVSTVQGFKSVEPDVIDLARSMGANPLKIFLKFRLPQALPSIFSGLKVSVTLAVVGAVVGEFVGSNSGIGFVLQRATGPFDLPLMFAALVVLSTLGVLLFLAVELVERWLMPWHASQRHDMNATA